MKGVWKETLPAAVDLIQPQISQLPRLAVVLGSGLGGFVDRMQIDVAIPYSQVPGMPQSTALGHVGRLIFGTIHSVPYVVLQGRSHLYEGYHHEQVTYAIRVLQALGVETLLLSCAAGGLNPSWRPGNLMLIGDTVDLLHKRDRCATSFQRPTFRPQTTPALNQRLCQCAEDEGVALVRGTYIAVTGPNYETRAEQRFLSQLGDAVGMSTVPEITVAAESGMQVAALAMITNVCTPDTPHQTSGEEVLQVASSFLPDFEKLVIRFARTLSSLTGDQC